jgi:hypothetical protein
MISYSGNCISSFEISLQVAPFTLFLDLVHCHAENNFNDRLRNYYTLNAKTINTVLLSKKK